MSTIILCFSCNSDSKTATASEDIISESHATDISLDVNTKNDKIIEDDLEQEIKEPSKLLVLPPPSPTRDSIRAEISAKSVFLKLGCCKDKSQRIQKCCCNAVLDKYRDLMDRNDSNLANYNMTDPILGACKRKLVKEFEAIDYPASEEGDDDMF